MNTDGADELLMEIASLVLDPTTQAPIVVLKDMKSETYLPIWIGIAEAGSIAAALRGLPSIRPLSHDLMNCLISELGGSVKRVVIHKLEDSTYYANIELCHADVVSLLDSRPSDAIALAVRLAAPIIVLRQVVEDAHSKVKIERGELEDSPADLDASADLTPARRLLDELGFTKEYGERDLSTMDRDKWAELLSHMGPEDFKYKM